MMMIVEEMKMILMMMMLIAMVVVIVTMMPLLLMIVAIMLIVFQFYAILKGFLAVYNYRIKRRREMLLLQIFRFAGRTAVDWSFLERGNHPSEGTSE